MQEELLKAQEKAREAQSHLDEQERIDAAKKRGAELEEQDRKEAEAQMKKEEAALEARQRSGSGKNEPHGRLPGEQVLKDKMKATIELKRLIREGGLAQDKKRLTAKIRNLDKEIDKMIKGDSDSQRGKGQPQQ